MVYGEALPLTGILEALLKRAVRVIAEEDSEASIAAIKKGYSRKLAYARKTQRVSLSGLHELFFGDEVDIEPNDSRTINRLYHVPGKKNPADLFTKGLDTAKHWWCMEAAGLVTFSPDRVAKLTT